MSYTSLVPDHYPRAMFYLYLTLIVGMWAIMSVSIVMVWPVSGWVVGPVNVMIGLLTRDRVRNMIERIDQ